MSFRSFFCCGQASDWERGRRNDSSSWRVFSLKELRSATNDFNFDNKMGEGGFGSVYWGQLWDGSQIAIKRLKVWSNSEQEFAIEVEVLGRVRHKNLLSFRGYCAEGQEHLIVYDYMPSMSLHSHLHGDDSADCLLDWGRRMSIAIGSAEGIALRHKITMMLVQPWTDIMPVYHAIYRAVSPSANEKDNKSLCTVECECYLHQRAKPRIIHQDIKARNVLLDSDFHARVADFGFVRLIPDGITHSTKNLKGTLGYLAPEYIASRKTSESSDVYSFGILLLELVSGRRPVVMNLSVSDWALPLARERKFNEMVDPKLNANYVEEELKRVVLVALICTEKRPEKRPTMPEVVKLLKAGSKQKLASLENDELFRSKPTETSQGTSTTDKRSDDILQEN